MPIDPVCRMEVGKDALNTSYQEQTYFFCSPECMQQFEEDPALYASETEASELEESKSAR
jgi:YHS domain-containing protein